MPQLKTLCTVTTNISLTSCRFFVPETVVEEKMHKNKRTATKDTKAAKETAQALGIQSWHDCRAKLTAGKFEKFSEISAEIAHFLRTGARRTVSPTLHDGSWVGSKNKRELNM